MSRSDPNGKALIDFGVAVRPAEGQVASADLHLVKSFDHGALLAVVDGVGHGGEAIAAADAASMVAEVDGKLRISALGPGTWGNRIAAKIEEALHTFHRLCHLILLLGLLPLSENILQIQRLVRLRRLHGSGY